jgi:hypothetical protein
MSVVGGEDIRTSSRRWGAVVDYSLVVDLEHGIHVVFTISVRSVR